MALPLIPLFWIAAAGAVGVSAKLVSSSVTETATGVAKIAGVTVVSYVAYQGARSVLKK